MTTEDRLSPTHPSPPLQKGRTEKRKYFISKRSCGNTAGTAVSAASKRKMTFEKSMMDHSPVI